MEHEKSFTYTLVLGVCVIISLLLVGRMLLYSPVPVHTPHMAQSESQTGNGGSTRKVYLSDKELAGLLADKLPQDFPIQCVSISVSKDGTVSATGVIQKDAIATGADLALLRSMLKWMPNKFDFSASFLAQSNEGALTLSVQEIKAAGFSLPTEQVPETWIETLNTATNSALHEYGGEFSSIHLLDGGIQLIG